MTKVAVRVVRKSKRSQEILDQIRKDGRQIVLKHVLGGASATYQIYPVGPPHTDGTPHTRDTFQVAVNNEVIASEGKFWTTTALGHPSNDDVFVVAFRSAGASFFLEWGTIYMEAQPRLREMVKSIRAHITNDLRSINISVNKL